MATIINTIKLAKLHTLIKSGINYTSTELAKRIGISTSCVYNYFDELEQYGAMIKYDKTNKRYYYTNDFEFKIIIISEEQKLIVGGKSNKNQIPKFWKNNIYFCCDK